MIIDRTVADALLTTTRAVRKRIDFNQSVERSTLEECVRIALQAPVGTPVLKQHFIVITEPEKKAIIADIYRNQCYPYLDQRETEVAAMADNDPLKVKSKKNLAVARWQADMFERYPVLVIAAKGGPRRGRECVRASDLLWIDSALGLVVYAGAQSKRIRGLLDNVASGLRKRCGRDARNPT